MPANHVPNLDCMDVQDVWAFYREYDRCGRKRAAELLGETPRGYVTAVHNLAHYAANKGTAMQCRARGDIMGAQQYETICDKIYAKLPEWARW